MAGSGEKLGIDPQIGQPTRWKLCREPFFSGGVTLSIAVGDFIKGSHVWRLPTESIRRAYVDWREKCICCVGQVFHCRVYIDSNYRDSRI
jgi:hypothetical protein